MTIAHGRAADNTVNTVVTIRDKSHYYYFVTSPTIIIRRAGNTTVPCSIASLGDVAGNRTLPQTICETSDGSFALLRVDRRLAGPSLAVEGSKFRVIAVRFRTRSFGPAQSCPEFDLVPSPCSL